jgi:hypothetical protein
MAALALAVLVVLAGGAWFYRAGHKRQRRRKQEQVILTETRPMRRLVKGAEEIGRGGHRLRLREHRTDREGAR